MKESFENSKRNTYFYSDLPNLEILTAIGENLPQPKKRNKLPNLCYTYG